MRAYAGAVAQVFKSRNSSLTAQQRGCLFALLTQAAWTKSDLAKAGYEQPDELCICGASGDCMVHRLLHCAATQSLRVAHLTTVDMLRLREGPDKW